jgi:hypothetical protein
VFNADTLGMGLHMSAVVPFAGPVAEQCTVFEVAHLSVIVAPVKALRRVLLCRTVANDKLEMKNVACTIQGIEVPCGKHSHMLASWGVPIEWVDLVEVGMAR